MPHSAKRALLLIDLQNDFCQGGALAVPDADAVIVCANQLQPHFDRVIATQDWHPKDHMSFAANHPGHLVGDVVMIHSVSQVLWPVHCVQGTPGAALHQRLDLSRIHKIIFKGTDPAVDSYSAFFDNANIHATALADDLRIHQIQTVYCMGLATDYCVKYSCLDSAQLGFNTYLIQDACRGVELHTGDIERSIAEMKSAGVHMITLAEACRSVSA